MKKLIINFLPLVLILLLVACEPGDSINNSKIDLDSSTSMEEATKTNEVSKGRNISGFDMKTNKTINWYGIDFSFPSYFDMLHEDSTDIWMTYYPEEEEYYASLMFQSEEFLETQDFFNLSIPYIVESTLSGSVFAESEIQKSEEVLIAGLSGWLITFSEIPTDTDDVVTNGIYSFVYNINTKKIVMLTCIYDSNDQSEYDYLGDYKKMLETAKLSVEILDLNKINNTNSAELDSNFVGKQYSISGIIDQAIEPSNGFNALVTIQPNVMSKGMGSTLPLEINIWLTKDEFESIGGILSVGKKIDLSARLTSISRNAISKNPAVKGYPIQLEFGEQN